MFIQPDNQQSNPITKIYVFKDIAVCQLVNSYSHFEAMGCINLQGQAVQLLPGAAHSLLLELLSLPVPGSIPGNGVLRV